MLHNRSVVIDLSDMVLYDDETICIAENEMQCKKNVFNVTFKHVESIV